MNRLKSKRCPTCNIFIKGGNEQLLNHMIRNSKCKSKIIYCLGCNKACVDIIHLNNHQKQQQQRFGNTICVQGMNKLENVQALTFHPKMISNSPVVGKKRKLISIEQPVKNLGNIVNKKSKSEKDSDKMSCSTKPKMKSNLYKMSCKETISKSTVSNNEEHQSRFELKHISVIGVTNKGQVYTNRDDYSRIRIDDESFTDNEFSTNDSVDYDSSSECNLNYEHTLDIRKKNHFDSTYLSINSDKSKSSINHINTEENNVNSIVNFVYHDIYPDNSLQHATTNESNSIYIHDKVKYLKKHRNETYFSYTDKALIDLYLIHKKSRAPTYLFDHTIKWMEQNCQSLVKTSNPNSSQTNILKQTTIPSRKTFVKQMYEKIYSKRYMHLSLPKEIDIKIDSSHYVKMTIFDFREVIAEMLSNEDIMDPFNLLFYDYDDPFKVHPRDCDVGEIITSDVFLNTHKRLCKKQNDILFPLILYNDEINLDQYSKLKLDPFLVTFGRLPIHIRNQSKAWRYFGFINNLKQYDTDTVLDGKFKMKVYHKCLKELFRYLKLIQNEGGIPHELKLRNGKYIQVNLILYVQFVVGDTKGHDMLCGRMGSHNLQMKQHVRDCCVTPLESDNINHKCKFRTLTNVTSFTTDDQFKSISFYNVDNALYDLDMGDNVHGIFGATLPEPLHVFEMQLLDLIADAFLNSLSKSSSKVLQSTIINIVNLVQRQSTKSEFPNINAFRDGITQVKCLTGSERYAKIFILYLALLCSDCVEIISQKPAKHEHNSKTAYGVFNLKQWLTLLEDSLIVMKWLKKDSHSRKDIYSNRWYKKWVKNNPNNDIPTDNDDDMCLYSTAQKSMKYYLQQYSSMVQRTEGNGLMIPKFHFVLHFVRNIARHGSVGNYDGSRPEAIAKDLAKSPGLRTQKHHKSLVFQTGKRYHEDSVILEAERLYNHKHCNNESKYKYFTPEPIPVDNTKGHIFCGGNFKISVEIHKSGNNEESQFDKIVGVVHETSSGLKSLLDNDLLFCLTNWLWINEVGGRLSLNSQVKCFTEMNYLGECYKCHPSYRSKVAWNDWVYVDWGKGYSEPLPAKLHMLLDISECNILSEDSSHSRQIISESSVYRMLPVSMRQSHKDASNYLKSSKKFAIIHSSDDDGFIENNNLPTRYHFVSKIANRVTMEYHKYRIVPIHQIVGRAFVLPNISTNIDDNVKCYDNTVIVVDNPTLWDENFLIMNKKKV